MTVLDRRARVLTLAALVAGAAYGAAAQAAGERVPESWEAIRREARILEDVFASALRNGTVSQLRVYDVHTRYLANQGMLVQLSIGSDWPGDRAHRAVQIDASAEALGEIPAMVHDILADLEIAIAPYEPEELQELQELRSEQRELRNSARQLRARLRNLRRERGRMEAADRPAELDAEIAGLETELAATGAEETAIEQEIDAQYDKLSNLRNRPARSEAPTFSDSETVDAAIASAVCDYGATLKSLPDRQHLSVSVRQGSAARTYVFSMSQVRACQGGGDDPEQLLESGYVYDESG